MLLFVVTLASTALTGAQFVGRMVVWEQAEPLFYLLGLPVSAPFIWDGLRFALSLLFFLTVHEFGHYFAARFHGVATSLPYYIPSPFVGIGTLGAVIRIREPVPSLRKLFDIGAAGPLAGFVVALGVLLFALATLPTPDYLLGVGGHEPLVDFFHRFGRFPASTRVVDPNFEGIEIVVGNTILYWGLAHLFPNVPPMYEMYHYPVLFAGWLGLFFTALNLMPVGQLDGGHILYALVGRKWHTRLARAFVVLLLTSTAIGFVDGGAGYIVEVVPSLAAYPALVQGGQWFLLAAFLYVILNKGLDGDWRMVVPALLGIVLIAAVAKVVGPPLTQFGWMGWWLWSALLVFFIRVEHPPVLYAEPLTPTRRWLGIASMVIFVLCFSIRPISIV